MSDFYDGPLKEFAQKTDVKQLAQKLYGIEKFANKSEPYWTEETYLAHVQSSDDRIFAALINGEPNAFVLYRFIEFELEVTHWSVREKGKGKGSEFFKAFLAQCSKKVQKITLECGEWNEAAHSIYKSYGFDKTGFRPSYYRSGEGAWIMERSLES